MKRVVELSEIQMMDHATNRALAAFEAHYTGSHDPESVLLGSIVGRLVASVGPEQTRQLVATLLDSLERSKGAIEELRAGAPSAVLEQVEGPA